jgi:hypothetical protein
MKTSFSCSFPRWRTQNRMRRRFNFPLLSAFAGFESLWLKPFVAAALRGPSSNCCRCLSVYDQKPRIIRWKSLKKLIISNLAITSSSSIQLSSKPSWSRGKRRKKQFWSWMFYGDLHRIRDRTLFSLIASLPVRQGISISTSRHLPWARARHLKQFRPESTRKTRMFIFQHRVDGSWLGESVNENAPRKCLRSVNMLLSPLLAFLNY